MSTRTRLSAALLLVALTTTACSGGAAPPASTSSASGPPSEAPAASIEGLSHPTGADEIILRFDEGGGFVPAEFVAAHVPYFTLYGDGTVVFVQTTTMIEPRPDGVFLGSPIRTATLSEPQIQALLEVALRDGGLAAARAEYQNPLVADAPTAVFEINADDASKTVSVVALGMEDMEPNADTAIKQAVAAFAQTLRDFDKGGSLPSAPYEPKGYRGVLTEAQGVEGVQVRDWPWPAIQPDDFTLPADPMVLPQAKRILTAEEAEALGIEGYEGGIGGGVFLRADDGKTYSFVLRPLLPDETE
jgi:hypothetical protein